MNTKSDLALIIVNYNNANDTHEFFQSLKSQSNYHVYIVDVSPTSQEAELKVFGDVSTYIRAENKGYAFGLNTGLKHAIKDGYELYTYINNDTIVQKDFVTSVIKSLNKHPKSLIGGKIYYYPGMEYHKERYSQKDVGKVFWYAGGITDWDNAYTTHRGVDEIDVGQFNTFEKTDFVTGCLMCFDKSLIDCVGMMNESYFLYYEDADWCEEIKKKNCRIWYDPSIVIWHKNAQSTGGSGSKLHTQYQIKNRVKYGLKFAPYRTKVHLVINYLLGRG